MAANNPAAADAVAVAPNYIEEHYFYCHDADSL